ncbi:T9SS type A sorting domain-containing protein [Nonlabens agnitus]|uniref:Secretion system C-terminal sorting domain-containing protein n=1 Tax=Nonlabens agnitus TaxID=870484 RepID=A0A2S9WUE1_9FLAO|nr:T9SS type A sorting domain-containing protein [Nonlabens agnitus]PRP67101.1 hypothetical protein BST86_08310 [Nonlabens agnitus]
MKNFTFLIAILFVVSASMAQVNVVNDAFIYSKGTNIYVKQEINLVTPASLNTTSTTDESVGGSAIYLRDEAQLIQDDDVANSGDGFISVFQEGAAGNFTYNYWSSPVYDPSTELLPIKGFRRTQIYFPRLTSGYATISDTDTDLVIDAQKARFLAVGQRDGATDDQDSSTSTVIQPLRIASRWLYSYNSFFLNEGGGGYEGWTDMHQDDDTVRPGYGFTMKGISGNGPNIVTSGVQPGQRYDFRGIPNNGTISVGVATGDFSLVGNPYPSALDLKQFMIDNQGIIDGQLYFWDSRATSHLLIEYEGGYGTYSPQIMDSSDGYYTPAVFLKYDSNGIPNANAPTGGGLAGPVGDPSTTSRRYAAIGQGFVIQRSPLDNPDTSEIESFAAGTTGVVEFRNSQRVFEKEDGSDSFFKAAPSAGNDQRRDANAANIKPAFSFEVLINEQYSRNMIVGFMDIATKNWDWGMEASNIANRVANDAYMPIGNSQAIIQVLPFEGGSASIPISFKSVVENSTFKIKVNGSENFSPEKILLLDKQTDTYHDILNDSYIITTGKGTVADRYEIVFEEKSTLSNGDELLAVDAFNIFQNNELSLLTIQNPAGKNVSDISVFDLAGRLVASQNPKEANQEFTFNTSSYSAGIYIVKVSTPDDEELAKKVIISN